MEAKSAEFRKKHAQKKPLINWHEIFCFSSIFSSKRKSNDEEKEEEECVTNWQIILIKCLLWLTLFATFIHIEFETFSEEDYDRRLTWDILSLLNEIYPWPKSLKHVRRLNQSDILLYPIEENQFEKSTRITNIPLTPCQLK